MDTRKPSVTLNWDPPANAKHPGDVTNYQIRFWDNDRDLSKLKCCNSVKPVKGSTTNIVITRESVLRPLTTFTFEVRACSGDNVSHNWKTASAFVGMWNIPEVWLWSGRLPVRAGGRCWTSGNNKESMILSWSQ